MNRCWPAVVSLCCFNASMCWSCAGPIRQTPNSFDASSGRSSNGVLGAPTLAAHDIAPYAGASLADALTRLRPDWLRPGSSVRGAEESARPVVYMNDVSSGDIRALQLIPSAAVLEVQLLSASEAQIRYGPACRCSAGVIRVQTRTRE